MGFIERVLGPDVRGYPIPDLDFRSSAEAGNESLVPSPVIIELELRFLGIADDVVLLRQECERKLACVATDRRIVGLIYAAPGFERPLRVACDAALNAVQGSVVAHTGSAPRYIVSWSPPFALTWENDLPAGIPGDDAVCRPTVAGALALGRRASAAAPPRTQRSSRQALPEGDVALARLSRVLSDWFDADVLGLGPGAESRFGGDCFLNCIDVEAWRTNLMRGGLGTEQSRMLSTAQRFVAALLAKLAAGRRIHAEDVLRRRPGVPPAFARTCLDTLTVLAGFGALAATPQGYRLEVGQRDRFGEVVARLARLASVPMADNVVPLLPRRGRAR